MLHRTVSKENPSFLLSWFCSLGSGVATSRLVSINRLHFEGLLGEDRARKAGERTPPHLSCQNSFLISSLSNLLSLSSLIATLMVALWKLNLEREVMIRMLRMVKLNSFVRSEITASKEWFSARYTHTSSVKWAQLQVSIWESVWFSSRYTHIVKWAQLQISICESVFFSRHCARTQKRYIWYENSLFQTFSWNPTSKWPLYKYDKGGDQKARLFPEVWTQKLVHTANIDECVNREVPFDRLTCASKLKLVYVIMYWRREWKEINILISNLHSRTIVFVKM